MMIEEARKYMLFPAYAGVILKQNLKICSPFPFPRVCGGDPRVNIRPMSMLFFSPRMRGYPPRRICCKMESVMMFPFCLRVSSHIWNS